MKDNELGVIMMRDVPTELRTRFRVWCATHQVYMNKVLLCLLTEIVKDGSKIIPKDLMDKMVADSSESYTRKTGRPTAAAKKRAKV